MNPITIPHISIPTIGIPTIGIPSVGFPSASGGGGLSWPAGMKEHIKAWYDPKKQGMTNFDVIEAYMEDFTTWTVNKEGVIANVTSKSITITNVLNSNPLIYAYDTFSVRLRIDGLKNGQGIFFGDNKEYTISENGIYDIDTTENIRTNFIGECNITITQLPTSILKDFSGNKHDAYLYGFKGKLNSGVGIYAQDFKNWNYGSTINSNISTKSYNKFHIVKKKADNWFGYTVGIQKANYYNKPYKLKFNFNKEIDDIKFTIISTDGNFISTRCFSAIINSGSVVDIPIISEEIFNNQKEHAIYYDFGTNKDIEIDVELIPDYPNQLCYDGKSYAVAYNMPILTDYTVMAERTWFEIGDNSCFASKRIGANKGAFAIEYRKLYAENFGSYNAITFVVNKKEIIVQSKEKYNDKDLIAGNEIDTNQLLIGGISLSNNRLNEPYIGCHGAIIVADRSLTEEEINWLKQNWEKL